MPLRNLTPGGSMLVRNFYARGSMVLRNDIFHGVHRPKPPDVHPEEMEIAVPGGIAASNVRAMTSMLHGVSYLNPNWTPSR